MYRSRPSIFRNALRILTVPIALALSRAMDLPIIARAVCTVSTLISIPGIGRLVVVA